MTKPAATIFLRHHQFWRYYFLAAIYNKEMNVNPMNPMGSNLHLLLF